jgi:acetyltransferase-like isoleucine patch superfamily enzyme
MFTKIKYFIKKPLQLLIVPISYLPKFRFIRETSEYQSQINFEFWFKQKILNLGGNKDAYWPVHPTSKVLDADRIRVGIDSYPGVMGGCYITGSGGLTIGDYTPIAPNVIIVTSNHDVYDTRKHISKPVSIGKYCWIGAGAKIMPGVTLGNFTIVGSGAVVTKSFPEGYAILGGNPAKIIRKLEHDQCIEYEYDKKYIGYIAKEKFENYRQKHLNF